ncbi:MAG: hypothetical protein J6T88_05310 [Bacteroidales bacterium]|nr:hypothetical protein [Bacteroidales bacterium]
MKKLLFFLGAIVVLLAVTSCTKERTCRCAVFGQQANPQKIRIIKIDKGSCEDVRYVLFDQDPVLYPDITDSVLCTDFDFEPYTNN